MSWRGGLQFRVAVAAAASIIVFLPAVTGDWLYDDGPLIASNHYVHSFEHWPRWFVEDFWALDEEFVRFQARLVYWRPLVSASYALDWKLSGGSPLWFHISNLLAHATASVLVFVTLRRWLSGTAHAMLAAALVWAVHPTKAESVAWISGRTDILCMIAILIACEGMARRLAGRRGGIALEVAGTLLAFMCKEQAIVLPAFAAIESWVARGRPAFDRRVVFRMLRDAAPQLALAIVYLGLRRAFMPIEAAGIGSGVPSLGQHALAVLESFGRYFELTFLPHDLSVQQGLVEVSGGEVLRSMPHVIAGGLGLAALIAAAVLARKKAPIVTIGIAFYLATLVPTSNIAYTQMRTLISERFLYLPVLGIAVIIGYALDRVRVRGQWALVAVLVLAAGAIAVNRSADFRDPKTFWVRELRLHPTSHQARRMVVKQNLDDKRYSNALVEVLQIRATSLRDRVDVALLLAQVVAGILPDRDRASLEALDRFCVELLEAHPPTATLAVRELTYTVSTTGTNYPSHISKIKVQLLVLRAEIAGRLGNDQRAVELARKALAECTQCVGSASLAALAIARAGHYDEALTVLENVELPTKTEIIRKMIVAAVAARDRALTARGAAQLEARASELGALELWGRAFDVLAPHKEDIKHAPKAVMGFAELAVRAGDTAVAREVLAASVSPAEIDALIAEWSVKMGWQ